MHSKVTCGGWLTTRFEGGIRGLMLFMPAGSWFEEGCFGQRVESLLASTPPPTHKYASCTNETNRNPGGCDVTFERGLMRAERGYDGRQEVVRV